MKYQRIFNIALSFLLVVVVVIVIQLYNENKNLQAENDRTNVSMLAISSYPSDWMEVVKSPDATKKDLFNVASSVTRVSSDVTWEEKDFVEDITKALIKHLNFDEEVLKILVRSQLRELWCMLASSRFNSSETLLILAENCVNASLDDPESFYGGAIRETTKTICWNTEVSMQVLDKLKELPHDTVLEKEIQKAEEKLISDNS